MKGNSIISLEDIIDRPVRVLDVPGVGKVKVRDPTGEDKLEAMKDAKQDPRWDQLDEAGRAALVSDFLTLRMIVEPKITKEDYYKGNYLKLSQIIEAVFLDYQIRVLSLRKKRHKQIMDFLELTKESLL